jgi:hypothetical protein
VVTTGHQPRDVESRREGGDGRSVVAVDDDDPLDALDPMSGQQGASGQRVGLVTDHHDQVRHRHHRAADGLVRGASTNDPVAPDERELYAEPHDAEGLDEPQPPEGDRVGPAAGGVDAPQQIGGAGDQGHEAAQGQTPDHPPGARWTDLTGPRPGDHRLINGSHPT